MPAATGNTEQSNPFIKQLASSNRQTRDAALSSLRTYLQRSTPFSELDFLKLWKGLFFCMWMSDKPLTQQRLARELADLVNVLQGRENFLGFVDAFWRTVAREWSGIDALRMDKFLYLVRCYVNQGFVAVSRQQWADEALLEDYLKILAQVPLSPRDVKVPNGLRYHVIEIYVDELDKVDTKRTAPLQKVLEPLKKLRADTLTKTVRDRVKEALQDERLEDWQAGQPEKIQISSAQRVTGRNLTTGSADDAPEFDDDEEFAGFGD